MDIESYINHYYLPDLALLLNSEPSKSGPSGMLCGATIGESLREHKCREFNDISAFFCCQYALNLLDYGIRKHFIIDHRDWLASVPPFADSTACSLYHGGVSSHSSMLDYLRRDSSERSLDLRIDNDQLSRYLTFFLMHINSINQEREFNRLSPQLLCEELNKDIAGPEFTLTWPPIDIELTIEPPRFDPWKNFPKGVTRYAQKTANPLLANSREDEEQNLPHCPKCGGTGITDSFRKRLRIAREEPCDSDSDEDKMCAFCRTSMFLRVCAACGTENRGVYECRSCGRSLGSITDITPDTLFIEEAAADPVQGGLEKIREDITRRPDDADVEQAVSSGKRQMQSYPAGFFDPNRFFDVLDKVRMKEGYFLDYFYREPDAETFGSSPDVFARKIGTPPLTCDRDKSTIATVAVADALEFEYLPSGLFQLALLDAIHDNFYRFAHANYGDYRPILTRRQYDAILQEETDNLKPEVLQLLQRQDIRPRVVMNSLDSGHVTMFHFNRYKGFFWIRYVIAAGKVSDGDSEQIAWLLNTIKF